MKRKIFLYGHPDLRKKCEEVTDFDDNVKDCIQDLKDTANANNASGLAAPQIGYLLRIFVCRINALDGTGYPLYGAPKVYVNPQLTITDNKQWIDSEGCLSIPKIYEDVPRPWGVKISALNENGEPFEEAREGWLAKPIFHENDHLNGVLYLDRISPHRRKALQKQLKRIMKSYK